REYTGGESEGSEAGFNLADVVYSIPEPSAIRYDSLTGIMHFLIAGERSPRQMPVADLQKQVEKIHIDSKTFVLGTDLLGRDMLSRLLIGTRISLGVGLISVLISISIGIALGAIAGYFRGGIDAGIMWLIN